MPGGDPAAGTIVWRPAQVGSGWTPKPSRKSGYTFGRNAGHCDSGTLMRTDWVGQVERGVEGQQHLPGTEIQIAETRLPGVVRRIRQGFEAAQAFLERQGTTVPQEVNQPETVDPFAGQERLCYRAFQREDFEQRRMRRGTRHCHCLLGLAECLR